MRRYLIAALSLLTLSGCYVNKTVVDPWGAAPSTSYKYWNPDGPGQALACEELELCVELPDEMHRLSLAEVLDIALVNNTETQVTWAEARQAAALYAESQSTAFPTISIDFFHTQSRTSYLTSQVEQAQNIAEETLIINNQTTWGPEAHLSYVLFDFGQRRLTSEAARYSLYFADYSHNREIQTLIDGITQNYYEYLADVKMLEANEADLANAEETLDAANLSLQKGVKSISDVLQARTQVLLAEIQLSEQRKVVHDAKAVLLSAMGLPANANFRLQKLPFIDPEAMPLASVDAFLDSAFQCRPDLLASRADKTSREMSLSAAKRQYLPVLDYNLNIGRTYYTEGFHNDYNMTSTFAISMPIFTGFHIRNSVKLAEAKVEEAEALLKAKELEVIEDVTTSHFNVGVAFDTLKASNQFLIATQEEYDVAKAQYEAGVNTILDLISAQTNLFDARGRQAEATKEWFVSLANLTYSTGIYCTR